MSSLTNINNNTRVVNVGRTTPVAPGQQPASKSIPVVLASDQTAVPVVEQNKVQSEVSLSLLGIPRSEVALGIFADVNTYDVNPSEWSSSPQYYNTGFGIKHLPNEAGALVEAPRDQSAVLTSKRFFRYQPGRVSAATFGIKCTVSGSDFAKNPVIRKYGIFDNFDGYYWETKQSGEADNFNVIRRTQSLLKFPSSPFGLTVENLRKPSSTGEDTPIPYNQTDDYRVVGKEGKQEKGTLYTRDRELLSEHTIHIAKTAFDNLLQSGTDFWDYYYNTNTAGNNGHNAPTREGLQTDYDRYEFKEKCHRDVGFALKMMLMDLEWGGDAHTRINTKNYYTGVFPQIFPNGGDPVAPAQFEYDLHRQANGLITGAHSVTQDSNLSALTAGVKTKLNNDLYSVLIGGTTGSTPGTDGFFTCIKNSASATGGTNDLTGASWTVAQSIFDNYTSGITWGSKKKHDVLFDSRKHFWSYYVSQFNPTGIDEGLGASDFIDTDNIYAGGTYQTYTFRAAANFLPSDYNANLIGKELNGSDYPWAIGDTVGAAGNTFTLITASDALAVNEFYRNIKYKCARDLEYIITGYRNDVSGGGNSETLYNASMYYKADGLSIFTQVDESTVNQEVVALPREIKKHKHLFKLIHDDLTDTNISVGSTSTRDKVNDLARVVIGNFSTETTAGAELGDRGFAGNIIAFRDGLLMVHAAVNDPSLLKDIEQIRTHVSAPFDSTQPTVFKLTKGSVTFGQKVKVVTNASTEFLVPDGIQYKPFGAANNLNQDPDVTNPANFKLKPQKFGQIFTVSRVYGPTGSEFSLQDEDGVDIYAYGEDTDGATTPSDITDHLVSDEIYVETVVPFIGDQVYNPAYYRQSPGANGRASGTIQNYVGTSDEQTVFSASNDTFPTGMQWPLRYSSTGDLDDTIAKYIGYIDTSENPLSDGTIDTIRKQYDTVIFEPAYINWIKNNVKPEFWGVYEYRVPRSRFSHDKLDGKTSRRVYSDLASGPTGIVRPGMDVLDENGLNVDATSEYEFDFTKVTMLKVEFSWYGAVGALFLAYVPIGNGEARWVRVHHLRASNQLKIASLGNATLPITYNMWGGGTDLTLGDNEQQDQTYGTNSHHIVKYGASYYIDGGDRGTVRLYSHNNNDVVTSYGKKWELSTLYSHTDTTIDLDALSITATTDTETLPDLVYFMGAEVKTTLASDTGIKVVWVDNTTKVITLSKQPQGQGITLIPDRANTVYGLETKDVIYSTEEGNPVRNRVQVYPTKMSTSNINDDPVRLRMKRTPIFQTLVTPSGTLTLTAEYAVTAANNALSISNAGYIQNSESIYGWFQGKVGEVNDETIFGRLYKKSGLYYFEVLESYNEAVTLNVSGEFLPDKRFFTAGTGGNATVTQSSVETAAIQPLADTLTSINVVSNVVTPIPNTGTNIATLYMNKGTEQVDLNTYFDYNKEYLSYPLTDVPETLYFAIDSDKKVGDTTNDIAIGLTWEEQ